MTLWSLSLEKLLLQEVLVVELVLLDSAFAALVSGLCRINSVYFIEYSLLWRCKCHKKTADCSNNKLLTTEYFTNLDL